MEKLGPDEQKSCRPRESMILAVLGFLTHTRHSMKICQLNEGSELGASHAVCLVWVFEREIPSALGRSAEM